MKNGFISWLTEEFKESEEMMCCVESLRSVIPKNIELFLFEKPFDYVPTISDIIGNINIRDFRFLLIAPEPSFIITKNSLENIINIMENNIDIDCLIPAGYEDVKEMSLPPYFTLRGFEEFSRRLGKTANKLNKFAEDHAAVFVLRVDVLSALSLQTQVSSVIKTINPQKTRLTYHAYIHSFRGYYMEERIEVLPLLPKGIHSILDVGCASALMWRSLKDKYRVTGIDKNRHICKLASSHLERVINGDFLTAEINDTFDCVICLDVIEHVYKTELFLQRVRNMLNKDGFLVLSIPNVGCWAVIEDLLAGRWDYTPAGILCVTHQRFFTLKGITNILNLNGFSILTAKAINGFTHSYMSKLWGFLNELNIETDCASLSAAGYYIVAQRRA